MAECIASEDAANFPSGQESMWLPPLTTRSDEVLRRGAQGRQGTSQSCFRAFGGLLALLSVYTQELL